MSDWFEEGLQFTCTQCGNCCTGPPGAVWFTEDEGKAMAKKLEVSEDYFYKRYARKVGIRWSLTENVISGKYDCVFLDRESALPSCKLYEARPSQCRTWPFWSENLTSQSALATCQKRNTVPRNGYGQTDPRF